jgi:hypothetical protein
VRRNEKNKTKPTSGHFHKWRETNFQTHTHTTKSQNKISKKEEGKKERGGSKVTPMLKLSSVVIDSLRLEGAGSSVSV